MANYSTIFKLIDNLYCKSSPVLISRGELLIDVINGQVIAQFAMTNISKKTIRSLTMDVKAFDVNGNEVAGLLQYPYLNIDAQPNMKFGGKDALFMPNPSTKSCMVSITSVTFNDGETWTMPKNEAWLPVPAPESIQTSITDKELVEQYKRETYLSSKFTPMEYEDLWICSCGRINKADVDKCASCRSEKSKVFDSLDLDYLKKRKEEYEKQQAEEKKRREQEEAEHKEKVKKTAKVSIKIAIAVAVAVVLAIAGIFIYKQVSTSMKYNEAIELGEAGKYDDAITQLWSVYPYKDSAAYINTFSADRIIENADDIISGGEYDKVTDAIEGIDRSTLPEKEGKAIDQISNYNKALTFLDVDSPLYYGDSYDADAFKEALSSLEEADGYGSSTQILAMMRDVEKYEGEWTGTATIPRQTYHDHFYSSAIDEYQPIADSNSIELTSYSVITCRSGMTGRNKFDQDHDGYDDETGEMLPKSDVDCDAEGEVKVGIQRISEGKSQPEYETVIYINISFDSDISDYCSQYAGDISKDETGKFKLSGTDEFESSDYATLKMDEKSIEGKTKNKTSIKLKKQ